MKLVLFLVLFISSTLSAFNIPVLTLNHEIGSRYEIDTFEEDNLDYISYGSYTFTKGYTQINETISKALYFKFKFFMERCKRYEIKFRFQI